MKNSILSVLSMILFNSRLKKYKYYIEYAKKKGYQVLSLEDFYKLPEKRNGKYFILRHDVDLPGICTRKMFEVEKSLGVKSTYYFRFSTIDKKLIQEMIDNRFDVGLHFETIADYAKKNKVKDKSEIDMELMKEQLKKDIEKFEKITRHKTFSCCSHGAPENRMLGISNNAITEHADMKEFGLGFEAYQKELYNYVDCHIMDDSIIHHFGFSYADTPVSAVNDGFKNIVFLAHPNHWYFSVKWKILLLGAIILGKGEMTKAERRFQRVLE